MRQRVAPLVLLLTSVALLVAAGHLSHADTIACPKVAFAPALDGRLDDWPPLPQMVIAGADYWQPASSTYAEYGGPRDISAEIRMEWDSQALYLAIETTDNEIVRVRSAAEIDRGDSVVLAITGEDSKQTNEFVVALLRSASLVWRVAPDSGEARTIARALAVRDEDGAKRLVYELSIPWAELKGVRPLPGLAFRLSVSVCDDDGAGLKGCLERATTVKFVAAGSGHQRGTKASPAQCRSRSRLLGQFASTRSASPSMIGTRCFSGARSTTGCCRRPPGPPGSTWQELLD